MKDLLKGLVAICAIAIIVLESLDFGTNGDVAKYGMLIIGGIALGADVVSDYLDRRREKTEGE